MAENTENPNVPVTNPPAQNNPALALIPFTPVKFSGPDALWAWSRLIVYGGAAVMTWEKHKTISYVLAGAAALSLASSLGASAWSK